MKTYLLFITISLFSCAGLTSTQELPQYAITKIDFLDDGQPIIYVKNDEGTGIIISQNRSELGAAISKIEVGKKYSLNLKRIERNFRGENDAYGVQSSKGTETIVWRKEDGIPLLLYESFNLSGVTVHKMK